MCERPSKRRSLDIKVTSEEVVSQETSESGAVCEALPPLCSEQVPDDTVVALHLLVKQFPAASRVLAAPFALRSQLYSLVKDRTCVDRQLDDLRMKRQVKMLKLPSLVDEYAYMFALDYCAMVRSARDKQQAAGCQPSELQVFDWLLDRVAPAFPNTSIHHEELIRLLAYNKDKQKAKDVITEAHVSRLLNAGLLVRDMQQSNVYLFSMAGAGPVVASYLKQRKDLVSALRRKRHPEIFVKELERRKLPSGALVDCRFLIRDMIGTNTLTQQQTTSGYLLRLTPRH